MKKLLITLLLFLSLSCLTFRSYNYVVVKRMPAEIVFITYFPTTTEYVWGIYFYNKASREIITSEHAIYGLNKDFEQMITSGKYRMFVTTTTNFLTNDILIYPEWVSWTTPIDIEIEIIKEVEESDDI